MSSRHQKIFLSLLLVILLVACGKPNSGSSGSGSTNPSPTPSVLDFEVQIATQWEQGGPQTLQADCVIPAGTTPYSGAAINQVCTNPLGLVNNAVTIPEGQLFFGKLIFTVNVGTNSAGCATMIISPYWYRASTAAAFTPPWTGSSSINCSASPLPAACYGGIAGDIIPSFPTYTGGIYFDTAEQTTGSVTTKSANAHTYGSNRFSVNNATNAQIIAGHVFASGGDALVAGSLGTTYQNYSFHCQDAYADDMYSFTLTLTDDDITGVYPNTDMASQATNQFPDWSTTSWQY